LKVIGGEQAKEERFLSVNLFRDGKDILSTIAIV